MRTFQQRARNSRHDRIIEASIDGIAAKGCFGFRIEDLAETVGVAKGSIYLHFRSKADLIRASFEESESRVLAEYERRLADLSGEVTAPDRLILISEILLNLDSSTGGFSRGVFTRLPCCLENLRREDVNSRVEELIASVLADGVSAGLRSGFPPEALAELLVDNVTSRFVRRLARRIGRPEAARTAVNFFLRGMGLREETKV